MRATAKSERGDAPGRRPPGSPRLRLLGLVALLLYLPGFWWGAPRALDENSIRSWGVDDLTPIGPLAQVHNIIEPKEVQNLGYPLMHSFMTAAVYTPYLGYLWFSGDLQEPSGEYPYGLADPVRSLQVLTWLAHLLSVLLGVGIVLCTYAAANRFWSEREALWAGLFAMLSYPLLFYARTGNLDGPMLFFIAAALAVFAAILKDGITTKRAIWLGVWVGFACATKEQSAACFIGVPVVLLWQWWRGDRTAGGPNYPLAFGAGLLAFVAAFGLGSGLFIDPDRYFAHVEFNRVRLEMARSGTVSYMPHYPNDVRGSLTLIGLLGRYLAEAVTYPGLVLAGVGIAVAIRRRSASAWALVPAVTYLLTLFLAARSGQLRYVMPVALVFSLFAARGLTALIDDKRSRTIAAVAAGWIVLAGGLRGLDLAYQMIRDSRHDATAWLESRLEPSGRVDFFGPDAKLPWMPFGVEVNRANEYLGAISPPRRDSIAALEIRARWVVRPPDVILVMPDVSSLPGEPHNFTLPPEIFEELTTGALGYRQVAFFETPRLFPWLPTPELDYPTVNPPIRLFARPERP